MQIGDVTLFAEKNKKYDHLYEQKSTIEDTPKQAWTVPQFDKSDEVKWHE